MKIIRKKSPEVQYADIGAGDLFFTKKLTECTNKPIYAVDSNYTSLYKTEKIILLKEVSDIPRGSIDCILMMDVLEHTRDDLSFLRYSLGVLNNKGEVLISVPAYQFLFSSHDQFLRHYRRYTKRQLYQVLGKLDLEIKEIFYFYTLLFIIRFLQIILLRLNFPIDMRKGVGKWKLGANNIITMLIRNILNVDFSINRFLSKYGILLPGLSLCVMCQKKSV